MKKFVTKPRIVLAILVVTFVALRYYIKPEWFDRDHVYYKVYNYQIRDIKPEKKIIKDITVNFVHDSDEQIPEGEAVIEDEMFRDVLNLKTFFHITFTDNTQADLGLENFNFKFTHNNSLYHKLNLRFPTFNYKSEYSNYPDISHALMLYSGDTLFQLADHVKEISYQVKNPKSGKMQTYYEYDIAGWEEELNNWTGKVETKYTYNASRFSWTPRYLVLSRGYYSTRDERQAFFDDYNKDGTLNFFNYYDYLPQGQVTDTFFSDTNSRTRFYSREFQNVPLFVSTTGSQFKMTVREIYVGDYVGKDKRHVKISSKTYTDENKDAYVSEVLEKKGKFSK